jgi:ParB family chromosome partitioning protein
LDSNKISQKSRLGRGLASLIPPAEPASVNEDGGSGPGDDAIRRIAVTEIVPNSLQPRAAFDPAALQELASSISEHGVLQPVMVRPRPSGGYELIAGERRFRAAQMAGLAQVPAIVRAATDEESLVVALIENVQREDLNAIEAARGYRQLLERFGLTQSALARQIGKAQPTIANALRLLRLDAPIQDSIAGGEITEEHGKALLAVPDTERRNRLWRAMVDRHLSVAESRRLARDSAHRPSPGRPARHTRERDVHWVALEDRFRAAVGMKVSLRPASGGGASLLIEASSVEDVEALAERLERP